MKAVLGLDQDNFNFLLRNCAVRFTLLYLLGSLTTPKIILSFSKVIPQIILFVIPQVPGNIVNVLLSKVPLFIFIFVRFKNPRSLQEKDANTIKYNWQGRSWYNV
jgi:hypothetical protein